MKKVFMLILLGGLMTGCAYLQDANQGESFGANSGLERGTTGTSTGADTGYVNANPGSDSTPPPPP